MFRSIIASAVCALITTTFAHATTVTLTIDAGVQFYNDTDFIQDPPPENPVAGSLTGTLDYNTLIGDIVSADLTVSGLTGALSGFNQDYNVVPGFFDQVGAAGTGDFAGEELISFYFDPELSTLDSVGQTVSLTAPRNLPERFFSYLAVCNVGDAGGCANSSPQAVFDGTATVTSVPAPIPLPAGLPLLAAGLGALVVVRRRRG